MARMSFSFNTRYSSPSSLNSVPPYLANKMRSPSRTSMTARSPLSNIRPLPTAITVPSWGFSLAVSGITMPLLVISSLAAGFTTTRSPTGRIFCATTYSPFQYIEVLTGIIGVRQQSRRVISGLTGIWKVVNDTRNIDRTVLGIVTVTGAAGRAAGTAIGYTPRQDRRPENFDITVGTAQCLALQVAFAIVQIPTMLLLFLSVFCVHILWPV